MMTIQDAYRLMNNELTQAKSKTERKLYGTYVRILASLENKELVHEQIESIHKRLTSLDLEQETQNKRKYYKQQLSAFQSFLKKEFSFTPVKHFTELIRRVGILRCIFSGKTLCCPSFFGEVIAVWLDCLLSCVARPAVLARNQFGIH